MNEYAKNKKTPTTTIWVNWWVTGRRWRCAAAKQANDARVVQWVSGGISLAGWLADCLAVCLVGELRLLAYKKLLTSINLAQVRMWMTQIYRQAYFRARKNTNINNCTQTVLRLRVCLCMCLSGWWWWWAPRMCRCITVPMLLLLMLLHFMAYNIKNVYVHRIHATVNAVVLFTLHSLTHSLAQAMACERTNK